jgi:hypothetical protein
MGGHDGWGKSVQPVLLTSSYSSLQGTNQYSAGSVIQRPHEKVTYAGVLLTKWSQFHPASTRMPNPLEGRSKQEGKVAVSRSASLPGGVNHASGELFWSDNAEKRGKQFRDSSKQPIVPIRHDQINLGGSCVPAGLGGGKSIHPCPDRAQERLANTSLFPSRSTRHLPSK